MKTLDSKVSSKIKLTEEQFKKFLFSCSYNRSVCRSAKAEYARMNEKDYGRLREYLLEKYIILEVGK